MAGPPTRRQSNPREEPDALTGTSGSARGAPGNRRPYRDKPGTKLDNRKDGRYAGRVRLAVVLDRSAESLCGFVESTVAPGSLIVTDDWSGYAGLGKRGYEHFAVAECGDPEVAEQYLPIIHLVFANLKTWLIGIHHGVSHQHLQAHKNPLVAPHRGYDGLP